MSSPGSGSVYSVTIKPSRRSARRIAVTSVLKLWRHGGRREPPNWLRPRAALSLGTQNKCSKVMTERVKYDPPRRPRASLSLTGAIFVALSAALSSVPGRAQDAVQALAARAEQFEKVGRWEDAAAAYREILKVDPRSIAALNRLGAVCVRQDKFEEAVKY